MNQKRNYWLIKSEPADYSIQDLKKDAKTAWTGVRNYQARNFMRKNMKVHDLVLFYHSNIPNPEVAGEGSVVSGPYPDPTQFDKTSDYYDPKATLDSPRWFLVEIGFKSEFEKKVSLEQIKKCNIFFDMPLVQKGNRLSVQPIAKKHFEKIIQMSREQEG
jgi:predicted RNA-binding protein with PUA-like domain